MINLAKRIRDCRYAKGWGPDELSSRAAISRTALYQIECGKTETPRAGTLRRIAQALEMPIESLLAGRDVLSLGEQGDDSRFPESEDSQFHGESLRDFAEFQENHPSTVSIDRDLERKFTELLASPLGEGVARIVEESYRLLPARDAG